MEAKKISQRAVKSMINSNTILLHIGNFEKGKRTNLKRAVNECVYASRLYYNTELQSDSEKIEYLVCNQPDRLLNVKRYETHIVAINEYTEYHINFDESSKYYILVIGGMMFLIVSDMGWCNIWQVFDSVVDELDKDPLLKEIKQSGVITEDQIQTLKKRSNDLQCNIIKYMSKEYKLTVEFRNGQRYCYYGKTKKQAIAEFKRNFGNFSNFVKKQWELV